MAPTAPTGECAPFALWIRFDYCSKSKSPDTSRKKKGKTMDRRQEHIALTLLHFVGSKLAELYQGKPEQPRLLELIAALEGKEIDATEESAEHEQGKLPAPPEA